MLLLLCCGMTGAFAKDNSPEGAAPTATTKKAAMASHIQLTPSATPPVKCDAANNGAITLTSGYMLCVCKNGSGWVTAYDRLTACTW